MQSSKMKTSTPQINSEGMQFIEDTMRPSEPCADKTFAQLVAEEERRRILAILKHRLKVTF